MSRGVSLVLLVCCVVLMLSVDPLLDVADLLSSAHPYEEPAYEVYKLEDM